MQAWLLAITKIYESSNQTKLHAYASFNAIFGLKNYVITLELSNRRQFMKLRIGSHYLAIETASRYPQPTPRKERWFKDCNNQTIEDEKTFSYPVHHIPVRGINSLRNLQSAQNYEYVQCVFVVYCVVVSLDVMLYKRQYNKGI